MKALALLAFAALAQANPIIGPPTLRVECSGYELSADCITGTVVTIHDGIALTYMLPVSHLASDSIPYWSPLPDPAPVQQVVTPEPSLPFVLLVAALVAGMVREYRERRV